MPFISLRLNEVKKMKVCTFGELLIDVTPYGLSDKGYPVSEFNPGGAPANVAVALVNLGVDASFIGQVGDDHWGHFLKSVLDEKKVDTSALLLSKDYLTTLAMVHLAENGERSFSFYRKEGADVMIKMNQGFKDKIDEANVFHLGSVSMSDEPSRSTSFDCLNYAKTKGKIVSYDPNLRELLWRDLSEAKKQILKGMQYADIVKVSEEELYFLTNEKDDEKAAQQLMDAYPISILLVTYGAEGCAVCSHFKFTKVAPFKVQAVDTTGAGDGFFGAFLAKTLKSNKRLSDISHDELCSYAKFANACGAIATTKKGAIGSLATEAVIKGHFGDIE